LGPTTLSGFADVYYGYNYNHPINNFSGLRFFDGETNGFGFNMAELMVDKAPDASSTESRMGYHVAAAYGEAAASINGSDLTGDGSNFFIKEAYGSYLAPIGKGLTVTVGKFVTNAGAEVIESNANWNYSRSILFYYAIPYFHFGAKAAYTFNPKWSANVSLVNGWNNSAICHDCGTGQSSGLTYGASVTYTPNAKWSAIENYYAGPVVDFNGSSPIVTDWKQLFDTIVTYTPNSKWSFMLNGDYGFGPKQYICVTSGCDEDDEAITKIHSQALPPGVHQFGPAATWWGVAGYAKYTINPKSNFAVRYEYYDDPQGYTGLGFGDKAFAQEVTGTYSYNVTSGLLVRGEYRYDFASEPIFTRGDVFGAVKEQNTATLGIVYSFSSANAK
jgi:Putative beta-barrel porin-2, OmpL-like. bbp2